MLYSEGRQPEERTRKELRDQNNNKTMEFWFLSWLMGLWLFTSLLKNRKKYIYVRWYMSFVNTNKNLTLLIIQTRRNMNRPSLFIL
jgi:hypothetical protein